MSISISTCANLFNLNGKSAKMQNSSQRLFGLALLFGLASAPMSPVSSWAVPVQVTQAEFTTGLGVGVTLSYTFPDPPQTTNYSRTLVANSPVSDYMEYYSYGNPNLAAIATATASWLQVWNRTYEANKSGGARAYAISDVAFSPLYDAGANLSISITPGGNAETWSDGFVSLVDVTGNRPLWYYEWRRFGTTPAPAYVTGRTEPGLTYEFRETISVWPQGYINPPLVLAQNTALSEDHLYRLVMYSGSDANGDGSRILMTLSGIEIIPEPSTFTLLGLGAAVLMISRRRR